MISRVSDLKYKIIQSYKKNIDAICFQIKDRNFYGFKNYFEKYKIDPDSKDTYGNSLLILAVQSNCFQIVNYLLNAGASVNMTNQNKNTPLHFALTFRNFEIADMLIRQGADENIQNKYGITPWMCLDNRLSIL
jgi:ankyrin repeat protein